MFSNHFASTSFDYSLTPHLLRDMLKYSGETTAARPSPEINQTRVNSGSGEEHMSMFFDFGTVPSSDMQDNSLYQGGAHSSSEVSESQESAPRTGGIRVSLACIPVSTSFY